MLNWIKRIFLIVTFVVLAYSVVYILVAVYKNKAIEADARPFELEQLHKDGEFQFCELEWGMSVEEVNAQMPYSLESNSESYIKRKIIEYSPQNTYVLDGKKCKSFFQFEEEKLVMIQHSFRVDENYKEWFEVLIEELRRLYGVETDTTELFGEENKINSIGYRWDKSETTLQIVLITGNTKKYHPSIIISVAKK